MRKRQLIRIIADHSDRLVRDKADERGKALSPAELSEVAPFLQLNERLKKTLIPVTSSAEFRANLKDSLMANAAQRQSLTPGSARIPPLQRKWVIIGAAAGSAISVAGIVAAVLLHQRSAAHT